MKFSLEVQSNGTGIMSPSPRRAWIEIKVENNQKIAVLQVALPTEGVD